MMIGNLYKKILLTFFLLLLPSSIFGSNLLIVPANINYNKEELSYLSGLIQESFLNSIAIVNNEKVLQEKENIKIIELALANKKYSKKIRTFFQKIKEKEFVDKLNTKYDLNAIIWYDFYSNILQKDGTIKSPFSVKICSISHKNTTQVCKNVSIKFDNELFFLSKSSYTTLTNEIETILNEIF